MDVRKLAIPLLAFAGGAVLGRLLGLKTLMRGAMTAAAVTGLAPRAMLMSAANGETRSAAKPRRKTGHRAEPRARRSLEPDR